MKRPRIFNIFLLLLAGVLFLGLSLKNGISPDTVTQNKLRQTRQRILDYASANNKLPLTLTDLPPVGSGKDGRLVDGWGNPLFYTILGHNLVILKGTGKDGRMDFTLSFKVNVDRSENNRSN